MRLAKWIAAFGLLSAGVCIGQVRPIFDCWARRSELGVSDYVTLYFGYNNNSTSTVGTFIREDYFVPFPNRRGQPFSYTPGEHHYVFSFETTLAEIPTTWFLRDTSLTVSREDLTEVKRCDANQTCWDQNNNGACDLLTEDTNRDGACTVHDCRVQGQTGPTGPAGMQGPQGVAGPAGPKGNPGLAPQFRVATVNSTTTTAAVSCATTEIVITGGGGCTVPSGTDARLAASVPDIANNGWKVTCSSGRASVYAVCNLK